MGTFLRYLLSFAVQTAWQRAGSKGAIPPMRMPIGKNKGKLIALPIFGPWQMMIAMWLIRQVWAVYGSQVKARLRSTNHPVANHVGKLLPDPDLGQTAANSPAAGAPSAAPASAGSTPAPRPAAQYGTQVLSDSDSDDNTGTLPPGSVLSSLRTQNP